MTDADPFEHDDAAYVLGALEPEQRARFEEHLTTCAACAARVAELADLPGRMAGLTAADLQVADAGDEPVPDLVLQRLIVRARGERRRRNWLIGGLGAAVAACVLVLVVAVWPSNSPAEPAPQAFAPVTTTAVQARAVLTAKSWGTEIEVYCQFEPGTQVPAAGWKYDLYAVTADGQHYLADWNLKAGPEISYVSSTAIAATDIQALEITTPAPGPKTLLRLTVH